MNETRYPDVSTDFVLKVSIELLPPFELIHLFLNLHNVDIQYNFIWCQLSSFCLRFKTNRLSGLVHQEVIR